MSSSEVLNAPRTELPLTEAKAGIPEIRSSLMQLLSDGAAPPEYEDIAAVIPIMGLGDEDQTGVFTSASKEIVLKLHKQRTNKETDVPAYGRGATIVGETFLLFGRGKGIKAGSVRQITLKLVAFLNLELFDGFPSRKTFLEKETVLWAKTKESKHPPDAISFEMPFPTDEGEGMVLPPSYITPFGDISSLQAKIIYRLEVIVKTKVLGVTSSVSLQQDVNYYPRSAPPQALVSDYKAFDPSGNWVETKRIVNIKLDAEPSIGPLRCSFWIPASRVFGITQTIPFHVQLVGKRPAIDEFLDLFKEEQEMKEEKRLRTKEKLWKLKVEIIRKITVQPQPDNPDADEVSREAPLGSALVHPLKSVEGEHGVWTLDMGGELEVYKRFKTPAIQIGGLTEKDFIILQIQPANENLIGRRVAFPIQLVTDTNIDDTTVLVVYPFKDRVKGAVIAGSWLFVDFPSSIPSACHVTITLSIDIFLWLSVDSVQFIYHSVAADVRFYLVLLGRLDGEGEVLEVEEVGGFHVGSCIELNKIAVGAAEDAINEWAAVGNASFWCFNQLNISPLVPP
ncbi:hypothetical protein DL96DRAFT_1757289 [Flagelloscypha sp. PMI_526]|nr:hypothetical protein DL96DRAFT_1757289 [Flagelloscypha sp. PMI_526]